MKLNKKISITHEKYSLYQYHSAIAMQIKDNLSLGRNFFSEEITKRLLERYKTSYWAVAFNIALKFHKDSSKDCWVWTEEWFETNKIKLQEWIEANTELGAKPKINFQVWCLPNSIKYILEE